MTDKVTMKREAGNQFYKNKQYDKAEKCYLKSLEFGPTDAKTLSNLSLVYYHTERLDESLKLIEQIIILDPHYKKAYYRKVICLEKMGRYLQAIFSANKWMEINRVDGEDNKESLAAIENAIRQCKDKLRLGDVKVLEKP